MRAKEFKFTTGAPMSGHSKHNIEVRWSPPAANVFKLNTDGAFLQGKHAGSIGGALRDSSGNWIIGFSIIFFAYSHVMAELQALHTGLEIALDKHITTLEVEVDSTEVIELFNYAHPNYQSTVESCRSLLRRLGNPVVRHNFRQGNKLADFLAKEGSLLELNNDDHILVAAPAGARPILKADKNGETTTKSISLSTCTKLAMIRNLNIICNGVTSIDANSTTTREASSLSTTATVMF
ncbi:hypothetical protein KY285_026893 [Solanum tuberosum]|nr:hypothetical protein KY285_026893 [Solanum tuberosum]